MCRGSVFYFNLGVVIAKIKPHGRYILFPIDDWFAANDLLVIFWMLNEFIFML